MTFSLERAEVYDCEVFPNAFFMAMKILNSPEKAIWEISDFRDDRKHLLEHLRYLSSCQIPMIGFNNCSYDYSILHLLWNNPNVMPSQIYARSKEIVSSNNRYQNTIWASDRFAPQIDLYTIFHFDNRAKATGLKTLQINMRSDNVLESSLSFDLPVTEQQIAEEIIPYNFHDVYETETFAKHSKAAIDFRVSLIDQFGVDVMNWNDTKIGEQMIIKRIGYDVCYDHSSGKRKTRQSIRHEIKLNDIIFPYIQFQNPEFNKVLNLMRGKVLRSDDFSGDEDGDFSIKTKGVFQNLNAFVNGIQYDYGLGGIHGSVKAKRIFSGNGYRIRDIDVKGLYPNIAIANGLHPEHLGQRFVQVYSGIPQEREKWQKEKGKKCPEANSLKLAGNGAYGKSNSIYSPLYDPRFTMSITVNGQLLISMLVERLSEVPTLSVIQANTDGVTYYIHEAYESMAAQICRDWEGLTKLVLEDADYDKMFIRDVNSYIAVGMDGSLKLKGAYWTPDPLDFHNSIAEAQPPAWHKNFSNVVSVRAAVAHMAYGVDVEKFIRLCTNPFDFCCAVKVRKSDQLLWGGQEQQRNTRFFISNTGHDLIKRAPPKGKLGAFKKAPKISDQEYESVMKETGGQWDARVCTKKKSKYEIVETAIVSGYKTRICNNIKDFDWSEINYNWYLQEAYKLVI